MIRNCYFQQSFIFHIDVNFAEGAGVRPEKGNGAGEGSGTLVLYQAAVGAGIVYPGGGSGETLLLSTTMWKEAVARLGLVFSPRQQTARQEVVALRFAMGGIGWTPGKILHRRDE